MQRPISSNRRGVTAVALALRAPVLLAVTLAALVTALARLLG